MTSMIAFQGAPGAHSDLACRTVFPDAATLPCLSFDDAFAAVREGRADCAMIPVENALAGRVADVHHLLPDGGLHIVGEQFQPIRHHLLALPGASLATIRTVESHVQALAQCRRFLRSHGMTPVLHADTAGAAADIAQRGDATVAAIASSLAGRLYGLVSLAGSIADAPDNTTRFLVLARDAVTPPRDVPSMTSLVFRVRSVPAALYKALGGFATNGVNITKLESYLVGTAFSAAQFHVDVEAHADDAALALALDELRFFADEVRILGCYPAHAFRRTGAAQSNSSSGV